MAEICGKCRYWSEMCAQSIGAGPIEALCLCQDGPKSGRYVSERSTCQRWAFAALGAIDSPDFMALERDPLEEYRKFDEIEAASGAFDEWIRELDENIIHGEFGFEKGEFNLTPELLRPLFEEGLTPLQAFKRALDAHAETRR